MPVPPEIKRMLKTYNQCKRYKDQGSFFNSSGPLILEYETEFERGKHFTLSWRQVKNEGTSSFVSGVLVASSRGSSVTMKKHHSAASEGEGTGGDLGAVQSSGGDDTAALNSDSAPADGDVIQEKTRAYVSVFDAIADVEGVIQSLVIVPQYLFYPPDEILATGVFNGLGEREELVFNGEDCIKLASVEFGIRRELVLCARNGTIRRHFMGTGEALELSQCEGKRPAKPMTNCLDIRSVEIEAGIFG